MRRIGTLALGLYALACLILIVTLSVNRYDWMAEPGSAVGRCDLPLDPDGPLRAFLLACMILAPWVPIGVVRSIRRGRPDMTVWIGLGLLALAFVWLILLSPSCLTY